MNLRNKKVINKDKAVRKKIQPEKPRKGKNKKEPKSSESYEQTNLSESNGNKKINFQNRLNKKGSRTNKSEKTDDKERQNKFLQIKRKRTNNEPKENERRDNVVNITEEYGRNKITLIDINESESEDESIKGTNEKKKESHEEIRKRTIFVKSYGEKIKESNLSEIFKGYGIISKVKFKNKNSALVEFNDKNSIEKIKDKKNKIYFKGKKLKIEFAKINIPQMREKSLNNMKIGLPEKEEKKAEKFIEINDNLEGKSISKIQEPEKKVEKNERYIDIELGKEKIEDYDKFTALEETVNELIKKTAKNEEEIAKNKEEIKNLKITMNIMDEIDKQKDIYYKTKFNYIHKNMRLLLNSYKVLYMRKLANLLLEEIYLNYNDYLIKETINKKNIIAVHPDIKEVNQIPSYNINMLIDFLRFIWEKCSSAIHINDENFPLQKEIFYEYLSPKIKISDKNVKTVEPMEIYDIIGIIFEIKKEKTYNPDKKEIKDSHLIREIKKTIKMNTKESNIKINNDEEEIFTISLSKSREINESDDKTNENEITKIFQNNLKEIDVSSKIKKLIQLIKTNQEGKKSIQDNIAEINGEYLYKLWKNSFGTLDYKKKARYKKYIPENYNKISLEKMGLLVCKLLKGIKITLFINDPTNIDKNIATLSKSS